MRNRNPSPDERPLFTPAPLPVASLDDRGRLACLRLIRTEGIGPVTFRELVNHCGGAEAALDALPEISRRAGRSRPLRPFPEAAAAAELERAAEVGANPLFTIEPGYPALLANIEVPPPLVYVKGAARLLARPAVAVVGSRNCSAAGRELARTLAHDIGHAGFVIVSGLARGIDGAAHEAALETGTVAVLAGGIDVVYPPEHRTLQARIADCGCLLSEQPPGLEPRAKEFPRRNRLISGLSHGVVIVEAARRSGTFTTARMAAEQGREVFAVPGHPLDPRAEGTNALLKDGATLVTCAADVLDTLAHIIERPALRERPLTSGTLMPPVCAAAPLPPPLIGHTERDLVVGALGVAPADIDALQRTTGLPARIVAVVLMELDLAGRIERHGRQLVALRPAASRDAEK